MVTAPQASSAREQPLDGLRGAGAIAVFGYHLFDFFPPGEGFRAALLSSPLGFLINGLGALHVFFVLSGFVLALSLDRDARPNRIWRFYLRRVFRIHPTYVAGVLFAWVLSIGMTPLGGPLRPGLASTACFHVPASLLPRALAAPSVAFGQLPVGWSLYVEIAMSAVFPLLFWFARKTHPMLLVAAALGLVRPIDVRIGFLIFTIDFALGIALFLLTVPLERWSEELPRGARIGWIAAAIALLQAPYALSWWTTGESGMTHRYEPVMIVPLALGAVLLVAASLYLPAVRRLFSMRWITALGEVSFSFYLIHFSVLSWSTCRVTGPAPPLRAILWLGAIGFAVSTGLAALGRRWVELPSVAAGRRAIRALDRLASRPRSSPT
jgi:hypothetical protein